MKQNAIQLISAMSAAQSIPAEVVRDINSGLYQFDNQAQMFIQRLTTVKAGQDDVLNKTSDTIEEGLYPFIGAKLEDDKLFIATHLSFKWESKAALTAATAVPVSTKTAIESSLINAAVITSYGGTELVRIPVTKLIPDAPSDTYGKILYELPNPIFFGNKKPIIFSMGYHKDAAAFTHPTVVRIDYEGIPLTLKK